jgi:hypothetical protein
MIGLGSFLNNGDSTAVAINSRGWVTGNAAVPLSPPVGGYIGVDHAFLWKPLSANGTAGAMIDLGTLDPNANGGLGQSWGLAINSSGVVVGESNPTGSTTQDPRTDAVIWQPGSTGSYTLSDLNNLIPSGTGWTLWRADAINDSGQIVAEAWNSSFRGWYALLLTPSTTTLALTRSTTTVRAPSSLHNPSQLTAQIANNAPSALVFPWQAPLVEAADRATLPPTRTTAAPPSATLPSVRPAADAAAMLIAKPATPAELLDQFFADLDAGLPLDG